MAAPQSRWHILVPSFVKSGIFLLAKRELARGRMPSRQCLRHLRYGWNNHAAVEISFLETMIALSAKTNYPILECGSGLTTIVLEHVAAKIGTPVWTLEHQLEWAERASRHAPHVNVRLSPVCDYGDFAWYSLPDDLPRRFGLIICDGPMFNTKGGRSGLVPLLHDRLLPSTVIMLDDIAAPYGEIALRCWETRFGMTCSKRGRFALVRPRNCH